MQATENKEVVIIFVNCRTEKIKEKGKKGTLTPGYQYTNKIVCNCSNIYAQGTAMS